MDFWLLTQWRTNTELQVVVYADGQPWRPAIRGSPDVPSPRRAAAGTSTLWWWSVFVSLRYAFR